MHKHLKKVHLARLSPVMWPAGGPHPNPPWWTPISSSGALSSMGNYEPSQPDVIHPRADPLWSDLYRITAAGALNRVAPFGPSAFGDDLGPAESGAAAQPTLMERARNMAPLLLAIGAGAGLMMLIGRR
jgi:hypothetical protein